MVGPPTPAGTETAAPVRGEESITRPEALVEVLLDRTGAGAGLEAVTCGVEVDRTGVVVVVRAGEGLVTTGARGAGCVVPIVGVEGRGAGAG